MVANVIHSDVWDEIIYNLKFNLTIININIVIDYKIHILLTNTGILGEDKERSMTVDNVCLFFFFFNLHCNIILWWWWVLEYIWSSIYKVCEKRRYVHRASLHVTCVKLDFLCLFTFYKAEFRDTKTKIFARILLYMIGRRKLVFLEWQFQFSSLN